jgi:hypothetical protein
MTAIDRHAGINVRATDEWVCVELRLDKPVTDVWARRFESLAQANNVPAIAHTADGRAWLEVRLPL